MVGNSHLNRMRLEQRARERLLEELDEAPVMNRAQRRAHAARVLAGTGIRGDLKRKVRRGVARSLRADD